MEGFPPSSMDELTEFDLESLYFQSEDPFNMSELLSYVILKHFLSEDDCLQFSYSSVYPLYYSMEAGRLTSTKAPYHAMIKVDRTMWSTIVFNKQLSFQFHFLKPWHQYSNIHQPQPGHGYMTPNATTSEHGGFIQPGPSFPAPRSQYFSNQGQVDRAAVIPNIDNVQQENFVPRGCWKDTSGSSGGAGTRCRGREN
ncbi:hypothetical protein D5086_032913 [Populus alba]|uniref:Uncharacterized protein n=1 Tax=Populus alba TaxID=43335 RepID=A0ACC4AFD3_POPAL